MKIKRLAPSFFNRSLYFRMSRTLTPSQALLISFGGLIIVGSLLLMLPVMHAEPKGISFINALFTATSAVCVTGLIVVDTGTYFSAAGQLVIVCLIQLGGLGIMTFSIFFLRLAGLGATLRDELAVRASLSVQPDRDVFSMVRSVVLYTLAIELAGAVLLFVFFIRDYPVARAAGLAMFHAVSAFCNAGFSLWTDNLVPYQTHYGVNLVVMALIITGGLGFVVLHELAGGWYKTRFRLSLHTKLVLTTTAGLIIFGFAVFLALEWNNVLKDESLGVKVITALFQSVTTRTAGFNTINFDHLTSTTLLAVMFLMYVGGSPGSTAGGIKTVNIAVMIGTAWSRFRSFKRVHFFRRSIPEEIVARGLTIILVSISVVIGALALLLISETGHLDHQVTRDAFLKLLFEAMSAFGTVGLSMGVTPGLTSWGKLIIIMTMFLGRLGPLTVALAMMRRTEVQKTYHYGEEDIIVG